MGIFFALVSAVLQSSKDLVSKKLAFAVDGKLSAFASFLFALPFYLVLLLLFYLLGWEDFSVPAVFYLYVILRSLFDALAEWLKMEAFSHGDISLVSGFLSLSPLFILLTAPAITGDKIPALGVLAVVIIVAGSVSAIGLKRSENVLAQKKGILFAVAAAFFFSLNVCFDRLAVQVASPTLSGFAMTLGAAILLLPLVAFSPSRKLDMLHHQKPFWLRGFFEVSFMVVKLYALQYLPAAYVAGIGKLALIFSIIGGGVFF